MPVPSRAKLAADAAAYAAQNPKTAILCNSSTWDDSASIVDVIKTEVAQANGYGAVTFTALAGAYDAAQSRHETGPYSLSWTGTSGGFSFDRIAYLTGANSTFRNRAVLTIDATANRLRFDTATALGLANGNKMTVTADAGGVVPAELISNNPLFIVGLSDTSGDRSIALSLTLGGSAIDFSAGSGTIRLRSVDGTFDYYDVIGSTNVATAQTKTYPIGFNWGSGTADVNAA